MHMKLQGKIVSSQALLRPSHASGKGAPLGQSMTEQDLLDCRAAVRATAILRGKRTIEILCILRNGPVRLGQLVRLLPSASKKVLTEHLRQLEGAGIVVRRDLSGSVRHIEYEFAEALQFPMHALLNELSSFGETHQRSRDSFHVE